MTGIASPRDRRNVTILFVDVVGSTSLIENLDAELVDGLVTPAIKAISAEVERFSGHVSHVMGDGLMAIFGVPYTLEDHATRAGHAALAIQERIVEYAREVKQRYGKDFQIRVGLNSGSVVMSVTGAGDNEIFHALGSPVYLASRIQSHTPPGGIGVSSHTHQLISAAFEFRKLGSFNLKGFSQPEMIHQLLRARDHPAREPLPGAPAAAVPMIGREAQRRQFVEAVARLGRGHGAFVLVSGEAGSGKTRFMAECRKDIEHDLLWLEGRSSAFDHRVSYWPFVEFLKDWLELSGHDGEERNLNLLVERLNDLFGAEADEVIPYVATLMALEVREPYALRVKFLDTDLLSRQILRAMRRLFERMAAQRPVIVAIDDFHWADDSSVALVEHLLGLCLEARILICVTSRSDDGQAVRLLKAARSIPGLEVAEIELPPLPVEQSIDLLERLIGKDAHTKYLRDQILYKAGGNPFFIEEVARSLIGSGALVPGRDPGTWTVTVEKVSVPDTIHDVVMARVDRLDGRLKHLLSVASVIGHSFLYTVLRAVAEDDEPVDGALGELRQRHFIEKAAELPELIYMFRHALTQEAVYESILLDSRKKLHEQVADCLLAIFEGRTQAVASVLAFHYARADQPDKTLRYLLQAADQSIKVAADAEALKYYEEALHTYDKGTAAPWDAWQKATIECRLAEAHFHRGNLDAADGHFVRALEACGDPLPKTRFGLMAGLMRQALIQIGHRVRPVRSKAVDTGPDRMAEIRLRIYEPYSWLQLFLDHEKMGYAILKSLNISEDGRWGEEVAKASSGFGAALDVLGWHGWAGPYHRRALELAEASGNPSALGLAVTFFGLHDAHLGRWDEALERFDIADKLTVQTGDLNTWHACGVYRAMVLIERGAFEPAYAIGWELVKQGREAAFDSALRAGLAIMGSVMWRLGALDQARQHLEDSRQRGIAVADNVNATLAWGELGLSLCAAGQIELAAEQLDKAALLVRQRKVRTFSTVPIFLGLAQVAVSRLEADRSRDNAKAAMRRCRDALSITRRYYFGLSRALRMMGTWYWLNDRPSPAERWWRESLAVALKTGARYEAALTHIEMGTRRSSPEDKARGEQVLVECRAGMSFGIGKPV